MKLYRFVFILILPFLVSCTYDYDFGGEFTPSIVVSSTITPDSTIKVYLLWSRQIEDTLAYKTVERFTAKIYQGSEIIFNGEGTDGLLSTSVYPKEGFQYTLDIEVPNHDRLSAKTTIPLAPKIELEYTGEAKRFQHLSLNKVELSTITRSIMIRSTGIFEREKQKEDGEEDEDEEPELELISRPTYALYANNPFCDQYNVIIDMYDVGNSVSYYEGDIRIPTKNIELSVPLNFSIKNFSSYRPERILLGYDDLGYPIYKIDDLGYPIYEYKENKDSLRIDIIAPSDDYDKFQKSSYLQYMMSNTTPIHSNIENGLGCFMGYSSTSITYKINYDER